MEYLKATDVEAGEYTISAVAQREQKKFGSEETENRVLLKFEETGEKVLKLNNTNYSATAVLLDEWDFNNWKGGKIRLYVKETQFKDRDEPTQIITVGFNIGTKSKASKADSSAVPF